jgi:hypothetical protein
MIRTFAGLLVALIVCLLPGSLRAQTVQFRNECRSPVVVQLATVKNNVLQRDQPCLLRSTEVTTKLKADVSKIVVITDAKTNRVLFKDVLHATKKDLAYGIVFDPRFPGRVRVLPRLPGAMKGSKVVEPSKTMTPP